MVDRFCGGDHDAVVCGLDEPDLHHEVGEAVDDGDALGAPDGVGVGVHHPEGLHDPLHPGQLDVYPEKQVEV